MQKSTGGWKSRWKKEYYCFMNHSGVLFVGHMAHRNQPSIVLLVAVGALLFWNEWASERASEYFHRKQHCGFIVSAPLYAKPFIWMLKKNVELREFHTHPCSNSHTHTHTHSHIHTRTTARHRNAQLLCHLQIRIWFVYHRPIFLRLLYTYRIIRWR